MPVVRAMYTIIKKWRSDPGAASRHGGPAAAGTRIIKLVLGALLWVSTSLAMASSAVTDISFSSRPGSKFEIRLDFDGPPPELKAYTIEKPAGSWRTPL